MNVSRPSSSWRGCSVAQSDGGREPLSSTGVAIWKKSGEIKPVMSLEAKSLCSQVKNQARDHILKKKQMFSFTASFSQYFSKMRK